MLGKMARQNERRPDIMTSSNKVVIFKMARLTSDQRIFVVKNYYKTKCVTDVQRKFNHQFKNTKLSRKHIYKIVQKFERLGTVADAPRTGRPRCSRSEENVSTLRVMLMNSPEKSVRRSSSETGIPRTCIHDILKKDLKLFPYKIQIMQKLSITDQVQRLDFCRWAADVADTYADAFKDVWFTDESHFLLSGHVCKQNMRFWADEQPHCFTERPLHSEKLTVWCAMSSHGVIGPYVFKETVNSQRYLSLLKNKFVPALRKKTENMQNVWFMQDGATAHTSNTVLEYLHEIFGDKVISRRYPEVNDCGQSWPAHSPDLNPCDYFLWGFLKSVVYRPKPVDTDMLLKNIKREVKKISVEMCGNVIKNFIVRVRQGNLSKGRHLENVINY
jgi:inhibitor of nuclear factor kappa-B kinase subunit alpha